MTRLFQLRNNFSYGFLVFSMACGFHAHATTTYTWQSGSTTGGASGVYGSQGTPSSSNIPGARNFATAGVDSSGTTWMLGGYGKDDSGNLGYLNDLWKYQYNSSDSQWEWTWVNGSTTKNDGGFYGTQGVPSAMNQISARAYAVQWVDSTNGNIWVFGGYGLDSGNTVGYLNDMWKYNVSSGQWTWVKGPNTKNGAPTYGTKGSPSSSNIPGARYQSVSWIDSSGNLWLFGGNGYYSSSSKGRLNDLWKYNTSTNQWTWISGSSTSNTRGTYGTKGTPSSTTVPGARLLPSSWTDSSGNLWLASGYGNDSTTTGVGSLNDVWKYNPGTNQWTWVSGSNFKEQTGVYGTMGIPSSSNTPGARYPLASWIDGSGNFWLFGGLGLDSTGTAGYLNDLWKYDQSTSQWTWSGGSKFINQPGTWGTLGTPSSSNIPSPRQGVVSWKNPTTGNLFLFGGYGIDSNPAYDYLNDLWEIAL